VYYYLIAQGVIDSMEKRNTSNISRLLTDAREQDIIPWEWIVDETRELERVSSWDDPADYVQTIRRAYRKDFWSQQPNTVEVWSEKGTVRGVLKPVLDDYGVGFQVMHGFSGATTVNEIATRNRDRPLDALYVGDWDPSGMYMSEHDLPQRIERYGGEHVVVARVALKREDVNDPALPSFDAETKQGDPRYKWFTDTYGGRCWEIDAMNPNALRERVRQAIEHHISGKDAWKRCELAQEAEQASLQTALDSWQALRRNGKKR